jgi:23S rRNA pseudouridine2605 synthase
MKQRTRQPAGASDKRSGSRPARPAARSRAYGKDSEEKGEHRTRAGEDSPGKKRDFSRGSKPFSGGAGGDRKKPFSAGKKFADKAPRDKREGDKKPYSSRGGDDRKKTFSSEKRTPFRRDDNRDRGFSKSKSEGGDRPIKTGRFAGKDSGSKPWVRKDGDDKPKRPYQKREGSSEESVERKPFTRNRESKPFNRERSDKPFTRDREKPAARDREDKPFSRERNDKPFSRERSEKPFSRGREKPGGRPRVVKPFDHDRAKRAEPAGEEKPFSKYRVEKPVPREERRRFTADNESRGSRSGSDKPWNRKEGGHEFFGKKKTTKFDKKKTSAADEGLTRLNKYISNAGICSRREADDMIKAGVISVNGKVITEMGYKVMPGDQVKYNNELLRTEKQVYLLLNKPKDFITTTDDPEERKTVMNLVGNACKERIYPVGRLDRNTTGVLLFTNDGDLAKKLTHPSFQVQKIYQVELDRNVKNEDIEEISKGIQLDDGFIKVDDIVFAGTGKERNIIGVELHSGKNRIVRRIFEHLGYEVKKLDRVVFAGLTKKDLPRGRHRFLTDMEIANLKMMTGKKKVASV